MGSLPITTNRFPFNWLPQRVGPETVYVIQRGEVLSFHSIGCPSEWGRRIFFQRPKDTFVVSIQLVAPASGASHLRIPPVVVVWFPFNWLPQRVGLLSCSHRLGSKITVSIQLVAPASGAFMAGGSKVQAEICFHSIGCPSEWGCQPPLRGQMLSACFHSIGCPSEWGLPPMPTRKELAQLFPFNWLPQRVGLMEPFLVRRLELRVSIQLVAPASGASRAFSALLSEIKCFHSIGCPSEWGPEGRRQWRVQDQVSIQLVAPASGACSPISINTIYRMRSFHSIGCPSEWELLS